MLLAGLEYKAEARRQRQLFVEQAMHGKRNKYHRSCAIDNIDLHMLVKHNQECGFDAKTSSALDKMLHSVFTSVDDWCQEWSFTNVAPQI